MDVTRTMTDATTARDVLRRQWEQVQALQEHVDRAQAQLANAVVELGSLEARATELLGREEVGQILSPSSRGV